MLTAGRFSNASNSDGDKRTDGCARAHEHAVSHSHVDPDAGAYANSDECGYCHAAADFGAVGNGYTHPDGHTDSYEHSHADADSNQYADT